MHRRNSGGKFKVARASSLANKTHSLGEEMRWQAGGMPYSKNPEGKATVSDATDIHESNVGIIEQLFNYGFGFTAIHNFRVDDLVI